MMMKVQTGMTDRLIMLKDTQIIRDAAEMEALASATEASKKDLARIRAATEQAIEGHG